MAKHYLETEISYTKEPYCHFKIVYTARNLPKLDSFLLTVPKNLYMSLKEKEQDNLVHNTTMSILKDLTVQEQPLKGIVFYSEYCGVEKMVATVKQVNSES